MYISKGYLIVFRYLSKRVIIMCTDCDVCLSVTLFVKCML